MPYSVRMNMDVFRVTHSESLAMNVCRVPYSVKMTMDVSCAT